jgi:hypothetical protein
MQRWNVAPRALAVRKKENTPSSGFFTSAAMLSTVGRFPPRSNPQSVGDPRVPERSKGGGAAA